MHSSVREYLNVIHLKTALSSGGSRPHLTDGSLGPPESTLQNGISIGAAVFTGLMLVTDRHTHIHTDRLCYIDML